MYDYTTNSPTTPMQLPNSSSALRALASLSPPSPILSPGELSTMCTSGEIPILFDSSSVDSIFEPISPSPCPVSHLICATSLQSVDPTPKNESSQNISNQTHRLQRACRFSTATAGTFGPRYINASGSSGSGLSRLGEGVISPSPRRSPFEQHSPSVPNINNSADFITSGSNQGYCNQDHAETNAESSFTMSPDQHGEPCLKSSVTFREPERATIHDTRSLRDTRLYVDNRDGYPQFPGYIQTFSTLSAPISSPSSSPHCMQLDNDFAQILQSMPSQTFSTLPSPRFASLSPDLSFDMNTPETSRRRSRFSFPTEHQPVFKESLGFTHPIGPCSFGLEGAAYSKQYISDSLPNTPMMPKTDIAPSLHRRSMSTTTESARSSSVVVPDVLSITNPRTIQSVPAPVSFLEYITVNFLIDQEGFRAVNPSFKLSGYFNSRDGCKMGMVAQFMPVQRKTCIFHYAPLDSPPFLRRVSTNGDETRDYISREASLTLKSNGVYTIRGTETCIVTSTSSIADAKLPWRLDYVVDDRRAEVTGKIMSGEKMLTLLTFSCAPLLLHPLQGKKVGIFHLMKKSVTPRWAAEKMEPPTTNPTALGRRRYPVTPNGKGLHQRARSHNHKKPPLVPEAIQPQEQVLWRRVENTPNDSDARPRRRRASSAGERSGAVISSGHLTALDILPPGHMAQDTVLPIAQHILPPSLLCELLSADMGKRSVQNRQPLQDLASSNTTVVDRILD